MFSLFLLITLSECVFGAVTIGESLHSKKLSVVAVTIVVVIAAALVVAAGLYLYSTMNTHHKEDQEAISDKVNNPKETKWTALGIAFSIMAIIMGFILVAFLLALLALFVSYLIRCCSCCPPSPVSVSVQAPIKSADTNYGTLADDQVSMVTIEDDQ